MHLSARVGSAVREAIVARLRLFVSFCEVVNDNGFVGSDARYEVAVDNV